MISSYQIESLATSAQTTQLNILREYVQHVFLSYLYQQKKSDKLLFKGGTALRIIHGSPRFSEDLDFDYITESPKDLSLKIRIIEKILQECMISMEKEGIGFTLEEAKKTSGGFLAILHFNIENQTIKIQLEISFRNTDKRGEIFIIASDFVPPYTVIGLETTQLVVEKLEALLNRKKARDFYDLYYILRKRMLPLEAKKQLPQVLALLASKNIYFSQELAEFLPKNQGAIIARFREVLIAEIKRN